MQQFLLQRVALNISIKKTKKVYHPLAHLMFENVQKRFLERRNKQLVSLMAYLNNSTTKLGRKDPITQQEKKFKILLNDCS